MLGFIYKITNLVIGLSLRDIAKEYKVDKAIIKHILEINNVKLCTCSVII